MAAVDEILASIPMDELAGQVGAEPAEVEQAARAALPALLGGLQANASDPSGASSIAEALGQHNDDLLDGGVSLDQVDPAEGQQIAQHIFGDNQEQVVSQLGGLGIGGSAGKGLIAKLIPILAPMVLSWLAKQVLGGRGAAQSRGGGSQGGTPSLPPRTDDAGAAPAPAEGGSIDDLLNSVLSGATKGGTAGGSAGAAGGIDPGSIIGDVLGGLLGGGRR
jgi:hypothetical protein